MTKKISQSAITGQQGVALIEHIVLKMGLVWHPRSTSFDAGIDGSIEIRDSNTGEVTNQIILVQSKAGDSYFKSETSDKFEFLCSERDLAYWLQGNIPVILIVSRPDNDEAYWIAVKDYFKDIHRRKDRKIVFDKNLNRLDEHCKKKLLDLVADQAQGIYFAPELHEETLYSNLLSIPSFGKQIHMASTDYARAGDVWRALISLGGVPTNDWILKYGSIISFRDLDEFPWNEICDIGTLETHDTEEWALTDDPDKKREFAWLLNSCLQEKFRDDLMYDRTNNKLYYVKSTKRLTKRSFSYKGPSGKKAKRAIFRPYKKKKNPEEIEYYRHSAFNGHFKRYNNAWYLEITPSYHYTSDGYREYRYREDQLSGIKRLEQNQAVLGQIFMWASFLTRPATLYNIQYPFLTFGSLMKFEVEFGINDNNWLQREEKGRKKSSPNQLRLI